MAKKKGKKKLKVKMWGRPTQGIIYIEETQRFTEKMFDRILSRARSRKHDDYIIKDPNPPAAGDLAGLPTFEDVAAEVASEQQLRDQNDPLAGMSVGEDVAAGPSDEEQVIETMLDCQFGRMQDRSSLLTERCVETANKVSSGWTAYPQYSDVLVVSKFGPVGAIEVGPKGVTAKVWSGSDAYLSTDGVELPGFQQNPSQSEEQNLVEAIKFLGGLLTVPGTKGNYVAGSRYTVDAVVSLHGETNGWSAESVEDRFQGMHWPGLFAALNPHSLSVRAVKK